MISSATSSSVLPPPTPDATSTPANAPSGEDSSASFSDVMQQHEGSPGQAKNAPTAPASPAEAKSLTPAPTASTVKAASAQAKIPATPLAPVSNLSTLMIQVSVLASKIPTTAVPTSSTTTNNSAPTSPPTPTEPTDLSALIVQATALVSGGKTIVATKTPGATTTADKTAKDSGSTTTTAKGLTTMASTPIDLSTLIAQTSILAQASPATTGNSLPSAALTTGAVGSSTKEKKSASTSEGGSFLQSGTAGSSTLPSALGVLSGLQAVTSGATVSQQLTSNAGTKNNSLEGVAATASVTAGTANVEKKTAMNAQLNSPELTLLSGNGGNVAPSPSSADLHIQLASNSDFTDALKQVMHVAQLTQTSESRTPMRVEMEIQTPPGAIVNVYVSKQDDGWRAQLSTNDPAALSWVQDQVSSLRQSSDLGVEVKWLPPQLEGSSTIATSGSQDSNLSWNQGGQGQSNYQQPDERRQSGQQPNADPAEEFAAAIQSNPFTNTLSALGRAA